MSPFTPQQRLYPVHIDGKSGYIDALGQVIVSPRYELAGDFHDGFAPVGEFDPAGTPVIRGLAKQRIGFINAAGELVTPLHFDLAGYFSEGRAAVLLGKRHAKGDGSLFGVLT
jgi:hypothetical protein